MNQADLILFIYIYSAIFCLVFYVKYIIEHHTKLKKKKNSMHFV